MLLQVYSVGGKDTDVKAVTLNDDSYKIQRAWVKDSQDRDVSNCHIDDLTIDAAKFDEAFQKFKDYFLEQGYTEIQPHELMTTLN